MKNISVYGIYQSRIAAENAVDVLKREGFNNSDVSVLFSSSSGTKAFAHENSTKAPEGATTGGISGATLGGVLGWLAGIGSLAIPGVGPFIAAGPIMATLAGAGVGGLVGGLTGALIGLGIPEYEAQRYEGRLKQGGILLSVHADDNLWAEKAREVLKQTGAEDISKKNEGASDRSEKLMRDDSDESIRPFTS